MTSFEELLKKIKQKGYWVVNIRPQKYNKKLISLNSKLFTEYLQSCRVSLGGWDYPVGIFQDEKYGNTKDGIVVQNIEYLPEIWQFTTSGNFYHVFGLHEDYLNFSQNKTNKPVLGLFSTLFTLTSIFFFAKKLFCSQEFLTEDLHIEIQLNNIRNRELIVDIPNRLPFHSPKISEIENSFEYKKEILRSDLMIKFEDLAFDAFVELVRYFNFTNIPFGSYKNDQQMFLAGRI